MKYSLIILVILVFSCEKEAIRSKHAEGFPSFSHEKWDFEDVTFSDWDEDLVNMTLYYYNDSSGLIHKILIRNIPTIQDTIKLSSQKLGNQGTSRIATAFYLIKVGDDAQGEHYDIDSTSNESYIILNCVSKHRITGEFQLNFLISEDSLQPKFAQYIPDSFSIEVGQFNAKRY